MKNDRQKKIIELVENRCIETQEQLLDHSVGSTDSV